jgi:hypothetical protein
MSVSQTSRDSAFVNAITPALAAEYAARFGKPSLPASEPILTIRPRPARPHDWENLASHLEHTNQVDLKDVLPFTGVELLEWLIAAEVSGIVYEDIDSR